MEGSRKGRGKNIVRKIFCIYQFSSVVQSCLTLCNLMDCSMPGLPILHCLLEFAQTRVHWASDAIQPSHPLSSLSPLPSIFPSFRVFSNALALHVTWLQSIGASVSVLPMNTQGWFPSGLTGLISHPFIPKPRILAPLMYFSIHTPPGILDSRPSHTWNSYIFLRAFLSSIPWTAVLWGHHHL